MVWVIYRTLRICVPLGFMLCLPLAVQAGSTLRALALEETPLGSDLPLDHFMGYKAKFEQQADPKGKFFRFGPIRLADKFGSAKFEVQKPAALYLPADKNGEGVSDPLTHLKEYRIKRLAKLSDGSKQTKFAKISGLRLFNQCTTVDTVLELKKELSVLLPSHKDPNGPADPVVESEHALDHFKCYQAKPQSKLPDGTKLPKFPKGTQVVVSDQFQTRRYDLKKITKLCVPVDKEVDPNDPPLVLSGPDKGSPRPIEPSWVRNPDTHLLCYQAKPAKKEILQSGCGCDTTQDAKCKGATIDPKQAKHVAQTGFLNNQFGEERFEKTKELDFCIPSVDELEIDLVNINMLHNLFGDPGFDDIEDRLTLLADELAAAPPHVVTLQEVACLQVSGGACVPGQGAHEIVADALALQTGVPYFSQSYGLFFAGQAVISRWPLELREITTLQTDPNGGPDPRAGARIVAHSPIGPIDLYAIHLCAFCNQTQRAFQAARLVEFIEATHTSPHPALMGADFNSHKGSPPDGDPNSDPGILTLEAAGYQTLFDGFDAPCVPPGDRSGCTSGLDDLTITADTTSRRIDNIQIVAADPDRPSGAISQAVEVGPTARFADMSLIDPNPECHFDPRLTDCGACPVGTSCNSNGFCVRGTPIPCTSDLDCPGDLAPEKCRLDLWVSDHIGVQTTIRIEPLP